MTDLERAFLAHLGNQFTPYIGREEGLPDPPELRRAKQEKRQLERELREAEAKKRREAAIAAERAAMERELRQAARLAGFDDVVRAVCVVYGVDQKDIESHSRELRFFIARANLVYFARARLGLPYMEIARRLKRDHTGIISAYHRFEKDFLGDPRAREVEQLLAGVI